MPHEIVNDCQSFFVRNHIGVVNLRCFEGGANRGCSDARGRAEGIVRPGPEPKGVGT